ncbi:MAG: restriction endonuclease subunit S, partial [Acetobacter sp.]|nr:restriction endonuclease subunit S [Acetobacter sp.]
MSEFFELVDRLCSEGVEWKLLGDIAEIGTGKKPEHMEKEWQERFYPCINAGTTPFGYTPQFNRDGDIITTPSRGSSIGFVGYQEKPFWLGPLCYGITTKVPDLLMTKYIYYCLCNQTDDILKRKQGGAIPALNMSHLESIVIPLPPLEVQREIVGILDLFTGLTAELTAELELRKKQYAYYREVLLSFDEKSPSVIKEM